MSTEMVVLAAGFFGIIFMIIAGFIILRVDNSRTVRENIRLQTALARSQGTASGYYQSGSQNEQGEMGWLSSIISEVVSKNPELVTQFLSGMKKEG